MVYMDNEGKYMKFHEVQGIVIMVLIVLASGLLINQNIEQAERIERWDKVIDLCIPDGYYVSYEMNCINYTDHTIKEIHWTDDGDPFRDRTREYGYNSYLEENQSSKLRQTPRKG